MNWPPHRAPSTTPTIAEALIIVLYRVASLSFQPNLILITGATWLLPAIANPLYMLPKPTRKVNATNEGICPCGSFSAGMTSAIIPST